MNKDIYKRLLLSITHPCTELLVIIWFWLHITSQLHSSASAGSCYKKYNASNVKNAIFWNITPCKVIYHMLLPDGSSSRNV
jgi:hypothetical protein